MIALSEPLLRVLNLGVEFLSDQGIVQAVRNVSFELSRGETLGIVGESGSGKSVTNLAIMGLVPRPPGRIVSGEVWFQGRDLLRIGDRALAAIRGNRIAMIFQDPMTALNPFLTVADQMTEVTRLHLGHSKQQAIRHAIELLDRVGIPKASKRIFDYPHQFSGGMRQRVMIAMALSCKPDVLIADEPTTALDVTIQAQILELMQQLQREEGTAIILITHDLGIVAGNCHRVLVLYAGRVVERADVRSLFAAPHHPYTLGLLESVPRWDEEVRESLHAIPGQPPDLAHLPAGCAFVERCPFRLEHCRDEEPPVMERAGGGDYACFADIHSAVPHEADQGEA
jgi:oligopeptide transport system ATP-binding protein